MIRIATFLLTRLIVMLTAGTFLLAPADGTSTRGAMVKVPAALNPDKLSIFRVVSAEGVQVYTCTRNPAGALSWVFKEPDALLLDSQHKLVGKHYAGPTWEGFDGGKVVGQVRTSIPALVEKAIPWLLLDTKSRHGEGALQSSAWEQPAAPRPATAAMLVRKRGFLIQLSTYF